MTALIIISIGLTLILGVVFIPLKCTVNFHYVFETQRADYAVKLWGIIPVDTKRKENKRSKINVWKSLLFYKVKALAVINPLREFYLLEAAPLFFAVFYTAVPVLDAKPEINTLVCTSGSSSVSLTINAAVKLNVILKELLWKKLRR